MSAIIPLVENRRKTFLFQFSLEVVLNNASPTIRNARDRHQRRGGCQGGHELVGRGKDFEGKGNSHRKLRTRRGKEGGRGPRWYRWRIGVRVKLDRQRAETAVMGRGGFSFDGSRARAVEKGAGKDNEGEGIEN